MLLIDEQLPELPTILKNSIVTAEDSALAAAAAPSLRGALGEALQALGGAEVPSEKLERMVLHADTSAAQVAACKVLTSQCSGRAAGAATLAAATKLMKRVQPGPKATWVCRLLRKHLGCSDATAIFKEAPPRTLHSTCGCLYFDCPDLRETFMLHLQRCAHAGCVSEACW